MYYSKSKGDLCYAFLLRANSLLKEDGVAAYVTQNGWMYLNSYSDLRKEMLETVDFKGIVDLGANSFLDLNGEKTNVAMVIFRKMRVNGSKNINIFDLRKLHYNNKVSALESECSCDYLYQLDHKALIDTKLHKFNYILSGELKTALTKYQPYSDFGKAMQGTSTGDSKKYVRFQWEIEDKDWVLVSKGGGYSKWNGLNIYKVHWGSQGEIIKSNPKSVIRNADYFSETELVYSDTGTSGLSVRLLKEGNIFIASGPGIRVIQGDKYCHLAFLNSRIASYYMKTLSPKLTIAAGYIGQIPVPKTVFWNKELSEYAKMCSDLKDRFNSKRVINYEFRHVDYFIYDSIFRFAEEDFIDDLTIELERLEYEFKINKIIEVEYDLGIDHASIDVTVGRLTYTIDDNEIEILHEEVDMILKNKLDNNATLKITQVRKGTLGVEGVLEFFAVQAGYSPAKMYNFIVNNIKKYRMTIELYVKNTLHKLSLMEIGYGSNNLKISNDKKMMIFTEMEREGFNLHKWDESENYKWHNQAFKMRPLEKYEVMKIERNNARVT